MLGSRCFGLRHGIGRSNLRADPRLREDAYGALGLRLRDQDAVEADVEHAHALRQVAHLDGNPAFQARAALDRECHRDLLTGTNAQAGRPGDDTQIGGTRHRDPARSGAAGIDPLANLTGMAVPGGIALCHRDERPRWGVKTQGPKVPP